MSVFKKTRSKSSPKPNNRNVIQVTLPDHVKLSSKDLELYIPLNYQLLTEICSADLPDFAKILWLDSYRQSYAHCLKSSKSSESQLLASSGEFFCFTTFDELQKKYSCSKSKISKAFIRLEEKNFLKKQRLFQRHIDEESARQDKSIYKILLSDFTPNFISRKAYLPIPAATYNHILTTPILTDKEKQFYFLAHSLVEIKDKEEGRNEVGLCGKFWAKRLGCCIRTIFDMQKKLELHGYFKITRSKSSSNHNNRNVISYGEYVNNSAD